MKLGLVVDLDTCVGCHACATACKQWNTSGTIGPLSDERPHGKDPSGSWLNRIHSYEVGDSLHSKTVNIPTSCMHCVTVCPTGATIQTFTGFSQASVRLLDAGHSAPTFLNREFGYQVAADFLLRLRIVMTFDVFMLPLALVVFS